MEVDQWDASDGELDSDDEIGQTEDEIRFRLLSEIDLEIGLKQRLAQALQARIAWASILQDSLLSEDTTEAPTLFKDIALSALATIDADLEILFEREIPAPPIVAPATPRRMRTEKQSLIAREPKFLYIKSHDPNDSRTFVLRCPLCSKQAFLSLQGLYNHARLSHELAWGNHEECVRACAVEENLAGADLSLAVEIGGVGVPGVRSLFQMAVEGAIPHPLLVSDSVLDATGELTRTLGLHSESSGLASFLGKEPRKRGIREWAPDEDVDIDLDDPQQMPPAPSWRMSYQHRNAPNTCFPESEMPELPSGSAQTTSQVAPPISEAPRNTLADFNLPATKNRFHISARIIVTDRSLFVPPARRFYPMKNHTHKWMITVESPAYSYDITSLLRTVQVTSTDSAGVSAVHSRTAPPFVVIGTADHPFLARVELHFNGIQDDKECAHQKVLLEHWVELDAKMNKNGVVGEQQTVDVELDKQTKIEPSKANGIGASSSHLWDGEIPCSDAPRPEESLEGYEAILMRLLSKFPMTLKDAKGRIADVPYRLVATPSQLRNIVVGRRKAIEWGRASAIQTAYTAERGISGHPSQPVLTTGDVFHWLEDNGHFVREVAPTVALVTTAKESQSSPTEDSFCRLCGLSSTLHPSSGSANSGRRGRGSTIESSTLDHILLCPFLHEDKRMYQLSMLDIGTILTRRPVKQEPIQLDWLSTSLLPQRSINLPTPRIWTYPALVRHADPRLTLSIMHVVDALHLPHFSLSRTVTTMPSFHIDQAGNGLADVREHVAPCAMLAIATQRFIKVLLYNALDVSRNDAQVANDALTSLAPPAAARPTKKPLKPKTSPRMLTTRHIIRGVATAQYGKGNSSPDAGPALVAALSRLGVQHSTSSGTVVGQLPH